MISFDALAGNNALKNSLKHALNERFPQTVLLSGDDPAALKTLATVLPVFYAKARAVIRAETVCRAARWSRVCTRI